MEKRALAVLRSLDVKTVRSVRTPVATLSGGQRQSVAISRAVLWNSKIVLLDEPTAALGVAQTEQVLTLIRRLREQGLGVVLISHNLRESSCCGSVGEWRPIGEPGRHPKRWSPRSPAHRHRRAHSGDDSA